MAEVERVKRRVVYSMEGMSDAVVEGGVRYGREEWQTFDLYRSPNSHAALPMVVFVLGFSDAAIHAAAGFRPRESGFYRSWSELVVASGMAAITYGTIDPLRDLQQLLDHLQEHQSDLRVDSSRVAFWACSGNAPTAVSLLQRNSNVCGAALSYPFTLDLPGSRTVAEAAARFGFAHDAEATIEQLEDRALFLARAGRESFPALNESLDAFATESIQRNHPLTLMNHPHGPHAFDVEDPSERSREIITAILQFFRGQLIERYRTA